MLLNRLRQKRTAGYSAPLSFFLYYSTISLTKATTKPLWHASCKYNLLKGITPLFRSVALLSGPVAIDHGWGRLRGETAHGCYERQTLTPQDCCGLARHGHNPWGMHRRWNKKPKCIRCLFSLLYWTWPGPTSETRLQGSKPQETCSGDSRVGLVKHHKYRRHQFLRNWNSIHQYAKLWAIVSPHSYLGTSPSYSLKIFSISMFQQRVEVK
jgi:hypothetical protein